MAVSRGVALVLLCAFCGAAGARAQVLGAHPGATTGTTTGVQQGTTAGATSSATMGTSSAAQQQNGAAQPGENGAGSGSRTATAGAAAPTGGFTFVPAPIPAVSPGALELLKLEDRFEQDVAKGGGRAFSSWFAPDGVTLSNGKPAVQGQAAIAAIATWNPKSYQLQWYVEGAQMGPSGDTGWTWGHYETHATSPDGKTTATSGRYITFWKKVDGAWKVALDASADDPSTPSTASSK